MSSVAEVKSRIICESEWFVEKLSRLPQRNCLLNYIDFLHYWEITIYIEFDLLYMCTADNAFDPKR